LLVERFGGIVDAIKDHGDEGKGLTGFITVAQGLRQQEPPDALALPRRSDAEPGEHRDRRRASRQALRYVLGKVAQVDLPACQRIVAGNLAGFVHQNLRRRQVLGLALKRLGSEPVVHSLFPGGKSFAWVVAPEALET